MVILCFAVVVLIFYTCKHCFYPTAKTPRRITFMVILCFAVVVLIFYTCKHCFYPTAKTPRRITFMRTAVVNFFTPLRQILPNNNNNANNDVELGQVDNGSSPPLRPQLLQFENVSFEESFRSALEPSPAQ